MIKIFNKEKPIFLKDVSIPGDLKILVFSPHPDDFDSIGITLLHFKQNCNSIFLSVLLPGHGGVEDLFARNSTSEEKTAVRVKEQQESCRFFGLPEKNITFLNIGEDNHGDPIVNKTNKERVLHYLTRIRPDIFFLPHGNDTNKGHRWAYSLFQAFASQSNYSLMAFLFQDPKTISMRCDIYTPFDEKEAEWKKKLLLFHQSQHQRNLHSRNQGFDERILNVNRETARKQLKNEKYAEAFELEFWKNNKKIEWS